MRKIRAVDIFIGTNVERLINFPNLAPYEGITYYEVDTDRRFNIYRGEWVQIPPFKLYGTTSHDAPNELFINGVSGGRIPVPLDTTIMFDVKCSARRTDVVGESGVLGYRGGIKNNADTLTYLAVPANYFDVQDGTGWALSFDVSGTDMSIIAVGESGKDITWAVSVETINVNG